jgi:D-3-phosphoglycerate dehydrogenase
MGGFLMKGVAVGDVLIPRDVMKKIYEQDVLNKLITKVAITELECKTRADIRTVWRKVEEHGPDGVEPPKDLELLIEDADIVAVHICPISSEMIEKARNLKIIITARGGVENIDIEKATKQRIVVINTPNHNANAVAEYTIGLMIAETRNIARSHYSLKNTGWREIYPNTENIPELSNLKIGLIGFGQIGKLVAKKLQSFGVILQVYDPFVSEEIMKEYGCYPVSLGELLKSSDVISLHVRLCDKTRHMIGNEEFKKMKPSSYFINTARAGLVDENALIEALKKKMISGAAIDVYEKEPTPKDHPLFSLDNVTVTNHRSGDTRNSYWDAPIMMAKQLLKILKGEKPDYIVNPQVFKDLDLSNIKL